MNEWESRRLWRYVAKGIREGDFETASREKSKIEVRFCGILLGVIEGRNSDRFVSYSRVFFVHCAPQNEQRQRRRDEAAAGTKWELKHFQHIDTDPTCKLHPLFFIS